MIYNKLQYRVQKFQFTLLGVFNSAIVCYNLFEVSIGIPGPSKARDKFSL